MVKIHKKSSSMILLAVLFLAISLVIIYGRSEVKQTFDHYLLSYKIKYSLSLQEQWLLQNQKKDGSFVYQFNVLTGKEEFVKGNYTPRQIFSCYTLILLYKESQSQETKHAILKCLDYAESLTTTEYVNLNSTPLITKKVVFEAESLNNANSALLWTLVDFLEIAPEYKGKYFPFAQGLANYLVVTQKADGSFPFNDDPTSFDDFNMGESFYALGKMHHYESNQYYLTSVEKAANFIINYYPYKKFSGPFYGWGMRGFHALYQIDSQPRYWEFMKNYTDMYFQENGDKYDAFYQQVEPVAPGVHISAYLEGLSHVAALAKDKDQAYFNKLYKHTQLGIEFILNYQINSKYSDRHSSYKQLSGSFCLDYICNNARVDTVAHTATAFYFFKNLFDLTY